MRLLSFFSASSQARSISCIVKQTPGLNALLAVDELRGKGAHLGLCDELDELVQVVCNGLKPKALPTSTPLQHEECHGAIVTIKLPCAGTSSRSFPSELPYRAVDSSGTSRSVSGAILRVAQA